MLLNEPSHKVSEEIEERWHFNTAVAAIMELVNEAYLALADHEARSDPLFWGVMRLAADKTILLLAPMVPHLADELNARLGREGFLLEEPWPDFDPQATASDEVVVVLQVGGKLRGQIKVAQGASEEKLKELALENERVQNYVAGQTVKKVIVVPDRLVNVVI